MSLISNETSYPSMINKLRESKHDQRCLNLVFGLTLLSKKRTANTAVNRYFLYLFADLSATFKDT